MKKRSVITYIMTTWIISEIIMFAIVVLFLHLYVTQSAELDIRSSLSRQVSSLSDNIISENGKLSFDENKIEKRFPDMYIAIINGEGKVISGSVPEGVKPDPVRSMAPVKVTSGGTSYYYIDRDIKYTMQGKSFVRAYVSEDDILANYTPIRVAAYGGMIVILAVLSLVMCFALKRFKHSIKTMETSVERIGTSQSFEKHMEPSGHYKEIGSLIEANNRMLDRMNEVLREEEQFSSDVAHELRTPISVIKAQCQYVLGNCELDDEQRKSFEVILRQSNRLQELVQTLLELSRLERDKSNVKSEDIDLNEIVEAVCEGELIGNDGRDISIEYNCENAVTTKGDISLITIAVSNIVSNAVKFSPDGAVVYVETGENDEYVYVKVKDNGIGMSVEEREQIFKRFYKSDSSRNSRGYGLGMPLALKIAEKHGGTIEVESELGKGSQFTLLLKKL